MRTNAALDVAGISLVALYCSRRMVVAQDGLPHTLPQEKPDREMSAATERNYLAYPDPRPEWSITRATTPLCLSPTKPSSMPRRRRTDVMHTV